MTNKDSKDTIYYGKRQVTEAMELPMPQGKG